MIDFQHTFTISKKLRSIFDINFECLYGNIQIDEESYYEKIKNNENLISNSTAGDGFSHGSSFRSFGSFLQFQILAPFSNKKFLNKET